MIRGVVTADCEAVIRLVVRGPAGQEQEVEAVVDTGFDGWFSLPPALIAQLELEWRPRGRALLADGSECVFDIYEGTLVWDRKPRRAAVDEASTAPLVGMALLEGYELNVQVRNSGSVTSKRSPPAGVPHNALNPTSRAGVLCRLVTASRRGLRVSAKPLCASCTREDSDMSMWLYQINQQWWAPQRYRVEIWERERWSWPVRRKVGAIEDPQPGDTVVFFYAPSGGPDPGFYGWAVITEWLSGEQDEMYFRPVAPSDHLKMHPWWDADAQALADQIRGKVKQGTFWRVAEDLSATLRRSITRWASGYLSPQLAAGRTAAKPEARA